MKKKCAEGYFNENFEYLVDIDDHRSVFEHILVYRLTTKMHVNNIVHTDEHVADFLTVDKLMSISVTWKLCAG